MGPHVRKRPEASVSQTGTRTVALKEQRLRETGWDVVSIGLVLVVCIRVLWNLHAATDLTQADEPAYLLAGEHFLREQRLPSLEYSPMYAIWYALFVFLSRGPIAAYYLQQYVVGVLTGLLFWLYLRRIGVSRVMADVGAVIWSTQAAYLVLRQEIGWPRPYHFAFLFVLVAGIVLGDRIDAQSSLLFIAVLLFAAAARIEYFISVGVILVATIPRITHLPKQRMVDASSSFRFTRSLAAGSLVLISVIATLLESATRPRILFDSPFLLMDRSWFAFGQKFSAWYLAQTKLALNPYDDWQVILGRVFPNANSILGAMVTNPKEFQAFEIHNFGALTQVLTSVPRLQPYGLEQASVAAVVSVGVALGIWSGARKRVGLRLTVRGSIVYGYLIAIGLAAIPGIMEAPTMVYSLPLLFAFLVVVIVLADTALRCGHGCRWHDVLQGTLILCLLGWIIAPGPFDVSMSQRPQLAEVQRLQETLQRVAPSNHETTILDTGGIGYCAYLTPGTCTEVDTSWRQAGETLSALITRKGISAILVTPRMKQARLFRNDSEFLSLLARPSEHGWTPFTLSGSDTLLVHHGPR